MARKSTTGTQTNDEPNIVPCNECGVKTIAQTETADKSICRTCIPQPGEGTADASEKTEVPCNECGEPTETTSEVAVSICPDCSQQTAVEAGF